jgi:hypothetical protein
MLVEFIGKDCRFAREIQKQSLTLLGADESVVLHAEDGGRHVSYSHSLEIEALRCQRIPIFPWFVGHS